MAYWEGDMEMNDYNADKPKTIRTPYGDITLLPIYPEDLKKMKQSLLVDLKEHYET